ncbi:MAG: Rrf2 family transcriptional regulator, partial [Alphaproteobacteria bacterium]|nr:Rrf2 family transcriptional regulator [Alphaproteobacteria bacterium]
MTDYGIVLLGCLQQHHPTSANTLVQTTGIPAHTTARLLRQLTQHHILPSHQRPNGRYQLAPPPETITIPHILNAPPPHHTPTP